MTTNHKKNEVMERIQSIFSVQIWYLHLSKAVEEANWNVYKRGVIEDLKVV